MSAYTPIKLIEALYEHFGVKTIAALARKTYMDDNVLNDIKRSYIPVNHRYLLRFHETSGLSVAYLRHLLGDDEEAPYSLPSGVRRNYYWENGE